MAQEWTGPLEQVTDYKWRIPRSYKAGMRVDGVVYANGPLMKLIRQDEALEQVANVATMPGIQGQAMAMPDIHLGYGAPIGGVAAFDVEEGVVSPGMTGYDINCLSGDSQILHWYGYHRPIAAMETDWAKAKLVCQDFAGGREATTPVVRYLQLRPANPVYHLTTEAGDEIVATADHPFRTPDGMKEVRHLRPGDQVAVYPFEGVPYEAPGDDVILDEAGIQAILSRLGKGDRGNCLAQAIAYLKQRVPMPLRYDSPQLPELIKVLGFVFGDGNVCFRGQQRKGVVSFYGSAEDLEAIRMDVAAMGFTPSRVCTRERQHHITTTYSEYEFAHTEHGFTVGGAAFTALLVALGAPAGPKAQQDYEVPVWLSRAPGWQKRLFLAALFGAEMSKPQVFTERGYNFPTPTLSLNKREGYVESGIAFLESIRKLLAEWGVVTYEISQRVEQRNADGTRSHRLRLMISSRSENLIRFWGRIGFEYHQQRRALANAAVQYLKHKGRVLGLREEAAEASMAMYTAGVARQEIFHELSGPYVNERFLERSLYGGRATGVRVSSAFPTFEEYCQEATAGLGMSGMVWERVARIESIPFDSKVYDFTVAHPDHNFIANGFVVSNCGVRLIRTDLHLDDLRGKIEDLTHQIYRDVPSGVGSHGAYRIDRSEFNQVLTQGAQWAIGKGYGWSDDAEHLEERGSMAGARPEKVSSKAMQRGLPELGTLGSGNHFLEIQAVDEIYDAAVARQLGILGKNQIVLMIHCGSRGFGHQICTDYTGTMRQAMRQYNIQLPDQQLACAPFDSEEAQAYLGAMVCAVNYAFANRQCITHTVRQAFERILGREAHRLGMDIVYDVTHNIVKIEEHQVGGQTRTMVVHRKGATRAFPPGHPELPAEYQETGQPVLVPGDMGSHSYVLVGTATAMEETFGSTCHGAGRVLSRKQALKRTQGRNITQELARQGIILRASSKNTLGEEAPGAYKDVSAVVDTCQAAGISRKVARMRPLGVVKG